jgi:hypothetical protein
MSGAFGTFDSMDIGSSCRQEYGNSGGNKNVLHFDSPIKQLDGV